MGNVIDFILKLTDQLSPAMRAAASVADSSTNKMVNDIKEVAGISNKMGHEFDFATREAKKLEDQLKKMGNEGKKGSGGFGLGSLVKGNLISGAITEGLAMAKEFVMDTYGTALKASSLRTAINATTGGKGTEAVAQTSAIADKYGLNYEASLEGVKTLTGGLKSMNMPLAEQMKIFEGVTAGISAMKLGAEESKGAMLALGQMASKGVVSAEELRGQLGERVPGAFGIAAKAMNVTEAELGKMLQKGEVAAKDFLPRFAAEMQKTFGAQALEAANGPAAIQERFNNAIFNLKDTIGNGLMPVLSPIIEKLTGLATMVIPYIQQGIEYIVGLFTNLNSGTSVWAEYFNVIRSYGMALWETIQSLWKNIWHIVGGMIEWIGKSQLMKDIFWAIGELGKALLFIIGKIGEGISWIWDNVIKPILDAVEWIYGKIKGLFTGGKTEITVRDGTGKVIPEGVQVPVNTPGAAVFTLPKDTVVPGAKSGMPGIAPDKLSSGLADTKGKADSINSGGQRSIIINIGKQIEKLEIHTITPREGVDEMGAMIREELKRVMYSLNSSAA